MALLETSPSFRQSSKSRKEDQVWFPALTPSSDGKIRRKILIVEEIPSDSNILQVLLNVLNYESQRALGRDQALAMIRSEHFDAVLLDLRHADPKSKTLIPQIRKIRPSLVDRVLVITGEGKDLAAAGNSGHRYLPRATDIRLMEGVHRRLLDLWGASAKS